MFFKRWIRLFLINLSIFICAIIVAELVLKNFASESLPKKRLQEKIDSFSSSSEVFLLKKDKFLSSKIFQPTPYLGVTYNSELENMNPQGLRPIPRKQKGDCFIGVFGGSVAEQLTIFLENNYSEYNARLQADLNVCKGKKIVWINLSGGTFKQPYQYIAMSFYIEFLDVVVNLDGFNEVSLDPGINYPSFFPYFTKELYFLTDAKIKELQGLRNLYFWSLKIVKYSKDHAELLKSSLYIFSVSRVLSILDHRIKQKRRRIRFSTKDDTSGLLGKKERIIENVRAWTKFTRLQFSVASTLKIPVLFALQPNVHFKASKLLSSGEEGLLRESRDPLNNQSVNTAYPLLQEALKGMRDKGISAIDLSMIFESVTEQVYIDDCCHLNEFGNKKLAESLINGMITQLSN